MDKLFDKINGFIARFVHSEKLMALIRKVISKEMFLYLLFGVLTTVVNLAVFSLGNKAFDVLVSNVVAWIAAVTFAYITNKLFVFDSKSWAAKIVLKEVASFTAARLLTLGIEEIGLVVMIKWLHWNEALTTSFISGEMVIKIILAVIVVILNYIFSKLIIFRKKAE
ncbi:MAG: GtrA family protein [Clostridia bacterium]|nr:GtrA family protein [Clostridia bacterium]